MPRPYPPEFRGRAVALADQAGQADRLRARYQRRVPSHTWDRQDQIDYGELRDVSTGESAALGAGRKRIRELETQLAVVRQAACFPDQDKPHPKGFTR